MDRTKKILWWCTKKLVAITTMFVIGFVATVAFYEGEIKWQLYNCLQEYEVNDFALREYRGTPEGLVPAKDIDWNNRDQYTSSEILVPADAIDWKNAKGPLVPAECLDFRSDYVSTGQQVKIIDLDGDEEVLVIKRGTSFAAYKVKEPTSGTGSYASRY